MDEKTKLSSSEIAKFQHISAEVYQVILSHLQEFAKRQDKKIYALALEMYMTKEYGVKLRYQTKKGNEVVQKNV